MPDDADRHAQHEHLIGRFIYEPDFRIRFWDDPEGVLKAELGPLTEAEQHWINGLVIGRTPHDKLIERLLEEGEDYHTTAW